MWSRANEQVRLQSSPDHLEYFHLKRNLYFNVSKTWQAKFFSGALVIWNIFDDRILEILMCQLFLRAI